MFLFVSCVHCLFNCFTVNPSRESPHRLGLREVFTILCQMRLSLEPSLYVLQACVEKTRKSLVG